jgi:5-formyltetrahydrofolate cyclo-ligase
MHQNGQDRTEKASFWFRFSSKSDSVSLTVGGQESIQLRKRELRSAARARLAAMTPEARIEASRKLRARLLERPEWGQAGSILFFAPFREEPDIWDLLSLALAAGKVVTLPRYSVPEGSYFACRVRSLETDIHEGHMGIREPVPGCASEPWNQLDLILVPGVGFDLECRRLGRGRGFYDRILAAAAGRTCGVSFDEQILGEVPLEPHDVTLNSILTPTRWIEPSAAGI